MMNYCRDKIEGTYRGVGRAEKGPLCDPGSKLLLYREGAREHIRNAGRINPYIV